MNDAIGKVIKETLWTIVVALVLALFIRQFVVESFVVQGVSMEPNLINNERLLVNKLVYRFRTPRAGEIIVFHPPKPTDKDYIKRVIGVPGDTVALRNGVVFVNGKEVAEPYIRFRDHSTIAPTTVAPGTVFVLGDNRPDSEDSRMFGLVPLQNIKGEAVLVWWPPQRVGLIRRPTP